MTYFPRTTSSLSVAALLLLGASIAGCAARGYGAPGEEIDDNEAPPLANYDELTAGAPSNAELPADDKFDLVFPATFDLVADQSPVRDQGMRGTCAAFSTVSLMESMYRRTGLLANADFSEQYLMWLVKAHYETGAVNGGSGAANMVGAIHNYGIPIESAWPYERLPWTAEDFEGCMGSDDFNGLPYQCYSNGDAPLSARRESMHYSLPAGRPLNSGPQAIKAHLSETNTGVLAALRVFNQAWNYGGAGSSDYRSYGYVLYPTAHDQANGAHGGHQVLIVGWDDNLEVQQLDSNNQPAVDAEGNPIMQRGFFLFKNSWGTDGFGSVNPKGAGYGWVSYRYMQEFGTAFVVDAPDAETSQAPLRTGTTTDSNSVGQYIPDNAAQSATLSIPVRRPGETASVSVDVDITHPVASELVIALISPNNISFPLATNSLSGSNVQRTFNIDTIPAEVPAGGPWRLRVTDTVAGNEGQVLSWAITVNRTEGL